MKAPYREFNTRVMNGITYVEVYRGAWVNADEWEERTRRVFCLYPRTFEDWYGKRATVWLRWVNVRELKMGAEMCGDWWGTWQWWFDGEDPNEV